MFFHIRNEPAVFGGKAKEFWREAHQKRFKIFAKEGQQPNENKHG